MIRWKAFSVAVCLWLVLYALSQEGHHGHGGPEKLGRVVFPTSCQPAAQKHFERGVALLHSFWYEEAAKAFAAATAADSRCAMGYWGQAMSYYHPLWEPADEATLKKGWVAVEAARAAGAKTERERDYMAAIELFYKNAAPTDHRAGALAYSAAMEEVYQRYPQDREAAVFYALSLVGTALPTDKTFAHQLKAGQILERVFAEQPHHPGVAHYLIHSYDYPALAPHGLRAARAYAKIASSAPHALHMPSHIFTRLGLWEESIASNRASARAAKNYAVQVKMGATWDQELHAMDYLMYAYLQRGQYRDAKRVLEEEALIKRVEPDTLTAPYARAAIPARYALERQDWPAAAGLAVKPTRYSATQAITYFARAVGASRSGNLTAAREATETLKAISEKLAAEGQAYWADQVRIQHLAAAAWLAKAEGRNQDALRLMTDAANLEDSTEKHPVTPGPVVPAREMLGELYLESGKPADAARELAAALQSSPNRPRALFGAARAAEMQGETTAAKTFYQKFVRLLASADEPSPDVKTARAFLAKR